MARPRAYNGILVGGDYEFTKKTKLTISTRDLETNETLHIYGNNAKGWEIILKRSGSSNGHVIFPNVFDRTQYTVEECLDVIQRGMDIGRKGWGFNCACCGHTSDTNIREMIE